MVSGAAAFESTPPTAPVASANFAARAGRWGQPSRADLFAHERFDTSRWVPGRAATAADRGAPTPLVGGNAPAGNAWVVQYMLPFMGGRGGSSRCPPGAPNPPGLQSNGGTPQRPNVTQAGDFARISRTGSRQAASVGAPAEPASPLMGGHVGTSQRPSAAPIRISDFHRSQVRYGCAGHFISLTAGRGSYFQGSRAPPTYFFCARSLL